MAKRKITRAVDAKPICGDVVKVTANASYLKMLALSQTTDQIYPLDAPGIPSLPPNSAFLSYSLAMGDEESAVVDESKTISEDGTKAKQRLLKWSNQLQDLVRDALRLSGFTMPVEIGPHREKEARFVCGHIWGGAAGTGPRPSNVMIINKMPWTEDVASQRCLTGDDGKLLLEIFRNLNTAYRGSFYVTNLVKFMPPDWKTTLKAVWIKDCMHLLHHELAIVQPKYILCLGSDVSKALLGSQASVAAMEGRVSEFKYNSAFTEKDKDNRWHTAKVMTVIHPKMVIRDQSAGRQLERGLGRFSSLIKGIDVGSVEVVDHKVVDNHVDLFMALKAIEEDPTKQDSVIAVDAEWHGSHPNNKGSYVRSIQISAKPKQALGIKLHEAGGEITPGFMGYEKVGWDNEGGFQPIGGLSSNSIQLLNTFFNGGRYRDYTQPGEYMHFRRKRVVGHFFNADLEWLVALGLRIQDRFSCPLRDLVLKPLSEVKTANQRRLNKLYMNDDFKPGDTVPAWCRTRHEGGADTGLMVHAVEETASYKLETLAMRYTNAPRYDEALTEWKTAYCKSLGVSGKTMEGYGDCPDEVLMPYGMYDADVTLRLFYVFDVLLEEDYEKNNCREAFWESQIATQAVLEIHQTGITVDRTRVDFLTDKFIAARGSIESTLKMDMHWPDFNIRSVQHVREILFGHELNGKVDKLTGKPVRIRPLGAVSLGLDPLYNTGKPTKNWSDIVAQGREHEHSPSTNRQVLSILAQFCASETKRAIVGLIRDYRFLDQVLKTVLRVPVIADDEYVTSNVDGEDHYEYEDGLVSMCCDDGKVRTHIYQTKETGRWSSARPNLQNISKQRDPDYKRLLGEHYKYTLRSVLKASPGCVFVEADYVGAELFGMAVMSGDPHMIDHATRNQLAEDDPKYYDIHSNVACHAFKLKCLPTKSGLESIAKKHLRIVAKSVIFGIAYGRGPAAIAAAAKEQGINITVQEAQEVIYTIFEMYPLLEPFFTECKLRATGNFYAKDDPEYKLGNFLCNCFGRFRRFPSSDSDQALAAEFERQAMNFPIQSMIASAMSRAIAYVHDYKMRQFKATNQHMFNFVLQIHDAILLEVPYKYVQHVCEYVLPKYMRDAVPIYPTRLDGMPTINGPYTLGIEVEVMNHWGEKLTHAEAVEYGTPTGIGGKTGCIVNYSKQPFAVAVKAPRSIEMVNEPRKPRSLKSW